MGKALSGKVRIWWFVGAVALLAAVVFGGAALSAPKTEKPSASIPADVRANRFATEAGDAASRGETETAIRLAEKALALDSANKTAKRVLDRVAAKGVSAGTSAGTQPSGQPSAPASDVYSAPIKDLASLLPVAVEGWSAGDVVVAGSDAQLTFQPVAGSRESDLMSLVTFFAHDRGTAAKAATFIESVDRKAYPQGGTEASVGEVTGYFGSDGRGLFVYAFTRGRFAFEVVIAEKPGAGSNLRDATLKLAESSPAVR